MTDDRDVGADASAGVSEAVKDGESADQTDVGGVDFEDLSLPQRVFVAAVQNPTRGVVITGLFAFAFSFYVAFWLVEPAAAALVSAVGGAVAVVVGLIYLAVDRLAD